MPVPPPFPPFSVPPSRWGAQIDWDKIHDPYTPKDKLAVHYGGGPNPAGEFFGLFADEVGNPPPRPSALRHPWAFIRWRRSDAFLEQVAKEMRVLVAWERYHLSRGWRGLAYSFPIGQSGTVYRNRCWNRTGAHYTSDDVDHDNVSENDEAIACVFILGAGQTPTSYAWRSFKKLRRWSQAQDGIADHLAPYGHREIALSGGHSTLCPGEPLMGLVLRMRRRMWL